SMGRSWKATIPPAKSSRVKPNTSRRLFRAKSTTRRIIYCSRLLLQRVLQHQSIQDHSISGFDTGNNFLLVAGERFSSNYFQALEMPRAVRNRRVDPLAIMQVQNGGGGNRGPSFRLLT